MTKQSKAKKSKAKQSKAKKSKAKQSKEKQGEQMKTPVKFEVENCYGEIECTVNAWKSSNGKSYTCLTLEYPKWQTKSYYEWVELVCNLAQIACCKLEDEKPEQVSKLINGLFKLASIDTFTQGLLYDSRELVATCDENI